MVLAWTLDPLSCESPLAAGNEPARYSRWASAAFFVLLLVPALSAIWGVPWFVTQDGPAHLYNAHIIAKSFERNSPFANHYGIRWEPLPNWTGHLALVGLLQVLPARAVNQVMTSLTLVGFAASIVWLRWRVAGWRGMPVATLLAVLLALNVTWLLGFNSFLLGTCLFPITLGVWWGVRENLAHPGRLIALSALLVLGYFSHLVSLALTIVGILALVVLAPGAHRWARAGWTAVVLAPLIPLAAVYLRLSRQGEAMRPLWEHLSNPMSLASWYEQLVWIDPLSLARKVAIPFHEPLSDSKLFALLSPAFWFLVAMVLALLATRQSRNHNTRPRLAWAVLASILVVGGLVSPDSLGPSHGSYLAQRVLLFGLVTMILVVDVELNGWAGFACAGALLWAVAIQSAFVWEYAFTSDRTAGEIARAQPLVGTNQKVATLLNLVRGRFRANPLMHADSLLGVDTGNIVWNNYETRFYYFPVQVLPGVDGPDPLALENISIRDEPRDAKARAEDWRVLLDKYHDVIDTLVIWGDDYRIVAVNDRWFVPVAHAGMVHVLKHRAAVPRPPDR
jgi:hypothetical protein